MSQDPRWSTVFLVGFVKRSGDRLHEHDFLVDQVDGLFLAYRDALYILGMPKALWDEPGWYLFTERVHS